jgi:magnesium-transporting ATPase (P-type)
MRDIIAAIIGYVIVWALLIAFCVYVVRSWVRWFRATVKLTPPRWRSAVTTVGFGASTVSLTVIVMLGVHAFITGGLPYYSPPLMMAFRVGFLTALCGVLAALIGKGQLEVPTIISSLLCLLIWFVEAIAQ